MADEGRTFADLAREGALRIGDGHRAKLSELDGNGPLFLRAGALTDNGFQWNGLASFQVDVGASLEAKYGHARDVVITTKGNSIGRVGWVPAGCPDFVYSPHLSFWRVLDENAICSQFLYYWARSNEFTRQMHKLAFGTDMAPYFSLRDQNRLSIRLPNINSQCSIAEVLGALDDKITANDRAVGLTGDLAKAQFDRLVGGVPLGDAVFGDLAEIGGGGTPRTAIAEYWDGDVAWATPTDVTGISAPYLSKTNRTITDAGLAACSSSLYPTGSILMTSRATIGAFAVAQVPVAVNQGFIVVNAKDPDMQWWLYHEMRARVDEFHMYANGATFLELPRGRFRRLPVRKPSAGIGREFSAVVKPLHELAADLLRQNERLASTRDQLLPLLMSGRLRVKDAERAVEEVL